jgi:hypothetical protein
MNIKNLKSLFVFALILVGFNVSAQSSEWKFVKESNGVKVYYKTVEGSDIKEVKITTSFNASMNAIISVLTDVENYPKWVYGAVKSKEVSRQSAHDLNYYNKIDFPWPLSDRDIVIHTHITQDPKTKVVHSVSNANSSLVPLEKGYVRMTKFNSKWTFTPNGNNIKGEYEFRSNPGGNIPSWMVNMALDEGPVKTIQNLKKLIYSSESSNKSEFVSLE